MSLTANTAAVTSCSSVTLASVARSILRFRDQALEWRHSDGSGESAAEAARTVATNEGGTGKPSFGGELVSRLHTEHALRACDVRYVTREDLEQIGTSAEQCSIILEVLGNPAPAPSAEPSDISDARLDAGVPAAEACEDGAIDRTQSKQAEVSLWLEALGLGEWCDVFKHDLGLDYIDDLGMPPAPLAVPSWTRPHVRVGGTLCGQRM